MQRGTSPAAREKEMASSTAVDYDHAKEVKEFDDSKAGVKGLLDAGVTTIPRIFHQPAASSLTPVLQPPTTLSIPTIDLSLPRPRAVELASAAAREWGFFRVINHGVPTDAMSAALSAVQAFNELPTETKASYYTRDEAAGGVSFNSNFDLYRSDAASWRDSLMVVMAPTPPDAAKIPEVCRRELLAWDEHALGVAQWVMGLLSEGLGVEAGRLAGLSCLEHRAMACHYYPYCPQPELTMGHTGHTDVVILTVLVQNEVEGLLVKKGNAAEGAGEWVMVEHVPGAIVVNVGDSLQMISNDEYKSVEHQVIANPHKKPRVSIATFFGPDPADDSKYLAPLEELVSEEKPASYRRFTMCEVLGTFASTKLVSKSMLNHFKV